MYDIASTLPNVFAGSWPLMVGVFKRYGMDLMVGSGRHGRRHRREKTLRDWASGPIFRPVRAQTGEMFASG